MVRRDDAERLSIILLIGPGEFSEAILIPLTLDRFRPAFGCDRHVNEIVTQEGYDCPD